MSFSFYAHGKILLSGEYFVLDGAKAIGLPCKYGQSLEVQTLLSNGKLIWESQVDDGTPWFNGVFQKESLEIIDSSDFQISGVLQNVLREARVLNPKFLKSQESEKVITRLGFPRLWGLGSSSTLIYNIAKWSEIDPFLLSDKTLGGSGYDIACAGSDGPVLYELKGSAASFKCVEFNPVFSKNLYFVYLGKKQNSREGIKRYREKAKNRDFKIKEISNITNDIMNAQNLKEFQNLLSKHEQIVSETIEMQKVQDLYFSDFDGVVKSLGAWGGDFVLAATGLSKKETKTYFNKKGFNVFLEYNEMVLGA